MRTYPETESDHEELARLEAESWMVEALKLNPHYVFWGPHEDYMWKPGRDESVESNQQDHGWESRVLIKCWTDFGFSLDDLNEAVNFYFSIGRPSRDCDTCKGKGTHPDAQWITESWYRHSSPFTKPDSQERAAQAVLERFGCTFTDSAVGRGTLPPDEVINRYGKAFLEHCVTTIENGGAWATNLTQDEVDALVEHGRLWDLTHKNPLRNPTAAEVNKWAGNGGMGHDAINSWICCEQRCRRLGVPYRCPTCAGHGQLFTGPAHLTLTLWILHPRKGASRGVEVARIEQDEIPDVIAYLKQAAQRNAERFAKVSAYEGNVPARETGI